LTQQAEAIRAAIEGPLQWTSQVIRVGASIGASLPPHPDTSGEALIQMADQALYEAKNRGRGRVVVYTETLGRAQTAQIKLARDLRVAVAEKQFEIYLQPQLCLRRARIIGCEALLRWRHPDRGLLRPGAFLRAAERNGLLAEVDYLSMTLALDALQMLRSNGFDGVGMSLNVSSTVLADVNYPGLLNWALQARGIAPEDICVEVLETSILDRNGQDAMKAINRLKQLGVRVALDDFGIGYAGLAHMSTFDIDAIKLDRSMISRLEGDPRNRAVVRSIIRLSDLLGMQVVAEGVETQNQLDILRRTCCPVIQGFGLAHPMPVDKMVAWLRRAHVDGIVQFGGADLNLELTPKPRAS
jgi:EAL domain-containing protein (putative c-di-GMP-specific phosphodiesterase class I)